MKVAIYARVSTTDQNCEMQLTELREFCARCRWDVVAEYVDQGWSGAKSSRPELDRCMADARKRQFEQVVVWALDRWGRSTAHLLRSIEELSSFGVSWMSYRQNIDTNKASPTGQLLLTILGAIAQFEREMIRERTRAGQENYRRMYEAGRVGPDKQRSSRSGKNLAVGRPKKIFRRDLAAKLRKQGMSWRAIAGKLGVPQSTIRLALKGVQKA